MHVCMTEPMMNREKDKIMYILLAGSGRCLTTGPVVIGRKVTPANHCAPLLIMALLMAVAKSAETLYAYPSFLPIYLLQVRTPQKVNSMTLLRWSLSLCSLSSSTDELIRNFFEDCIERTKLFAPTSSDQSQNSIYLLASHALICSVKSFLNQLHFAFLSLWTRDSLLQSCPDLAIIKITFLWTSFLY